jgi:hypothetical protein
MSRTNSELDFDGLSNTKMWYYLRDRGIQNGEVEKLEKYISKFESAYEKATTEEEKNELTRRFNLEALMGTAIKYPHQNVSALLNLVSREYPFNMNVEDIIKEIFHADCREQSSEAYKRGIMIEFCAFDGEIKEKYIRDYRHMFNIKQSKVEIDKTE